MMYAIGRPNYRRARELRAEMEEVRLDLERVEAAGNFSEAQDLRDSLHDMQRAHFLCGVEEYEG